MEAVCSSMEKAIGSDDDDDDKEDVNEECKEKKGDDGEDETSENDEEQDDVDEDEYVATRFSVLLHLPLINRVARFCGIAIDISITSILTS